MGDRSVQPGEALAERLPVRGLEREERAAGKAQHPPRASNAIGAPLRLSSSVPIRTSALSAQHLILRQVFTRPLR
jgi:hypothetical protein